MTGSNALMYTQPFVWRILFNYMALSQGKTVKVNDVYGVVLNDAGTLEYVWLDKVNAPPAWFRSRPVDHTDSTHWSIPVVFGEPRSQAEFRPTSKTFDFLKKFSTLLEGNGLTIHKDAPLTKNRDAYTLFWCPFKHVPLLSQNNSEPQVWGVSFSGFDDTLKNWVYTDA